MIIPRILNFKIISTILLTSISLISGESLMAIGFEIFLFILILFIPVRSLLNSFHHENLLRPSVFGEEILTVI